MPRPLRFAPALLVLALATPALADRPLTPTRVELQVNGEQATGMYVLPRGKVRRLVVVAHGWGHTVDSSWPHHLVEIARHGALAVGMNNPRWFGGLREAVAQTLAVTRHMRGLYPSIETSYMLSVSMGGIVGGAAIAEGGGFDYWVNVEGVTNLYETWAEASAAALADPSFAIAAQIEASTGGPPTRADPAVLAAYNRFSSSTRGLELRAAGLKGAVLVHAPYDGMVPYNQARELVTALTAAGIAVHMHTVLGYDCRTGEDGNTTLASHVERDELGVSFNPGCFAGHARESLADHVVMRTGLDSLYALLRGQRVPVAPAEYTVPAP